MDLPEIDLKELRKVRREILIERVYSNKKYVEWLKKTKNKEWSSQKRAMTN